MIETMGIPKFEASQVKPLRQTLGKTQAEFAEKIGVTQELVSMWERGEREPRGPAAILLYQLQAEAKIAASV